MEITESRQTQKTESGKADSRSREITTNTIANKITTRIVKAMVAIFIRHILADVFCIESASISPIRDKIHFSASFLRKSVKGFACFNNFS